jgi:1-acyl-sn-glycerol-3-phosphate acyltransferase
VQAAAPSRIVQSWFDWYCRFALRKHFHALRLYGDVPFDPLRPTLYAGNHSSFWDVIVTSHLIRRHRRQRAFCMADAVQVRRHPFFRKVGAFSVDRSSRLDGGRALLHAVDLLNAGPNAVVIYPQGKAQHWSKPVDFEPGLGRVLERAPEAAVVIVALRYEFWLDQRPEVLVDLSTPVERTAAGIREQLTKRLTMLGEAGREFRPGTILLEGRRSIDDRGNK